MLRSGTAEAKIAAAASGTELGLAALWFLAKGGGAKSETEDPEKKDEIHCDEIPRVRACTVLWLAYHQEKTREKNSGHLDFDSYAENTPYLRNIDATRKTTTKAGGTHSRSEMLPCHHESSRGLDKGIQVQNRGYESKKGEYKSRKGDTKRTPRRLRVAAQCAAVYGSWGLRNRVTFLVYD